MRKTLLHTLILAGTAFCLQFTAPAFAQNPGGAGGQQPGGPTTTQPTQPGGPAAGPGVGPGATSPMDQAGMQPSKWDDKKFAKEAAIGGMAEVELGKLAQQKASSDAVKQFGQKMVDDHSKANEELKAAATKDGIELPTELDKKHQKMIDKLGKLSGAEFDKAYVKAMLKDHKKDVSEFQDEANKGTMSGIKEFAQKTLPTLEQHLDTVKDLNKSGGATTVSEAKQ